MVNRPGNARNKGRETLTVVEGLERLVTADEAAEALRISRRYLHSLAREGKIGRVEYSPSKLFFKQEDIEAFIRNRSKSATPPKRVDTTPQKPVPSSREVKSTEVSRAQLREDVRRWR